MSVWSHASKAYDVNVTRGSNRFNYVSNWCVYIYVAFYYVDIKLGYTLVV